MNVNEKKSKVMIISKKKCKNLNQPSFTLNTKKLDIVDEFTYLGVKLTSTGNFAAHLIQSREKALHAFFKINQFVNFKELNSKAANKLFDSMISPILTYGCEVWGTYQKQNFNDWDKSPIEKVHLRFCKFYLGINRKASNLASRAEIGRFPLKIFIDTLILKFYNHLITLSDDSIAKQTFLISKSLFLRNKTSFHQNIQNMFRLYNLGDLNDLGNNIVTNKSLKEFTCKMKNQYFEKWKSDIAVSKKLQFFKSFKDNYDSEKYLDVITNFEQRRHFTKFRLSNHQLAIETGRYKKLQVEDRICTLCDDITVESEMHMLFNCSFYKTLRKDFFDKINFQDDVQFDHLKFTNELFHTNNEKTIQLFSKYIHKCFKFRKAEISKDIK